MHEHDPIMSSCRLPPSRHDDEIDARHEIDAQLRMHQAFSSRSPTMIGLGSAPAVATAVTALSLDFLVCTCMTEAS